MNTLCEISTEANFQKHPDSCLEPSTPCSRMELAAAERVHRGTSLVIKRKSEMNLEAQDIRGEVEGDAAYVLVRQEQCREVDPVRVFVPQHVGLPTARERDSQH